MKSSTLVLVACVACLTRLAACTGAQSAPPNPILASTPAQTVESTELGAAADCSAALRDPDAILKKHFHLERDLENRTKAALMAVASLDVLATKLDDDVVRACTKLARDLGASDADLVPKAEGPGKKAAAACDMAGALLSQVKAQLGTSARITVAVVPPVCPVSMSAMADCSAKCDAQKPEKVACIGGDASGTCMADCSGSCETEAGEPCDGKCEGNCSGACEAFFTGKCDGDCVGTCDLKSLGTKRKCAGKCEGKCTRGTGMCAGKCSGACDRVCKTQVHASPCKATCVGSCGEEMADAKCSGSAELSHSSRECEASCLARVSAMRTCQPALVRVGIFSPADVGASTRLKLALENDLPSVIAITLGRKGRIEEAAAKVRTAFESVEAELKDRATPELVGCLRGSRNALDEANTSIQTSLKLTASTSARAGSG